MTTIDLGPDMDFQHAGDAAKGLVGLDNGQTMPPYQLLGSDAATARDAVMTHFNMKGYDKPVLAGECILMGVITGCTDIRKICFRGSEGGEKNTLTNLKTKAAAVDADGVEIPANVCILEAGETAGAWPATDIFLTRLDCVTRDQDGELAGILLLDGAAGEDGADAFEGRGLLQTDGGACYGIVAIPAADVPPLASLWVDVEIANGFAR